MGSSSGSNIHHQTSLEMLPPPPIKRKLDDRQPPRQPLFSSDASHTPEEPRSNFDQIHESPCAGHQQIINAMGTKKIRENEKAGNDFPEHLHIGNVSGADNMSLRAIAGDNVDEISAKMKCLSDDSRENLVKELIVILEGNGDSQKREYLILQKLVQSRTDLTAMTLAGAHRSQLEILVAINNGNPAILQTMTSFSLSRTALIEIFEQKRCRNVEKCETLLPANNCVCMTCNNKKGFCNLCMCLICNKYEFEVDTCPLSCNMCSHKIHKDCAMRNGLIGKSKAHPSKMDFRCQDCSKLIDLIIESCCKAWDWDALIKDFDSFSRILHRSDNPGQKELFLKFEDLKEKMKNGTMLSSITGREILMFFQELSMDAPQSVENGEGGKLIAPQKASNQIAEVERKMERDMPCSSEETLVLGDAEEEEEEEKEEEEHASPEAEVIEEGKTSGQTEVEAPDNPDGVQVEEVQPLEQPQQLVDADSAQPEVATRDAGPSSPNSSSNLRPSTLSRKFPSVPPDVHLFNDPNMCIPNNLPFPGNYSSSKDTVEATTTDQEQILAEFLRTHPTVQTHIKSFSKGIQNTFSERLATLLHRLHFVRVRDFNEATMAEVQEAWKDLTGAGFELQDLEPAVNQALHAKVKISEREEELTTKVLALQRDIQACRDRLDNPPLYNSDDHLL